MSNVNWEDPCQRAKALSDAYFRLLSGQQEQEVEYLSNGVQRRVKYAQSNLAALKTAKDEAEAECAAKSGLPNPRRRFAIQAGSRRPLY